MREPLGKYVGFKENKLVTVDCMTLALDPSRVKYLLKEAPASYVCLVFFVKIKFSLTYFVASWRKEKRG